MRVGFIGLSDGSRVNPDDSLRTAFVKFPLNGPEFARLNDSREAFYCDCHQALLIGWLKKPS